MEKLTLLERAKGVSTKRKNLATPEVVELAVAWANDEVTLSQVMAAMPGKSSGSSVYSALANGLKIHFQNIKHDASK